MSGWRDWMIGDVTRRAAWETQTRKLGEIPNATRAVEVSLRCTSHAVFVSVVSLGVFNFQVPTQVGMLLQKCADREPAVRSSCSSVCLLVCPA